MIIQGSIEAPQNGYSVYSLYTGFAHLAAGLCCGLSGMAAGMAIGIVGDAGVRAVGQQEKLFVGMILILIFAEALGLYELITEAGAEEAISVGGGVSITRGEIEVLLMSCINLQEAFGQVYDSCQELCSTAKYNFCK